MKLNTIIILSVICACFFIILLIIFIYYFIYKKPAQVSPDSAYQVVADSSVSNIFDSIMPQRVFDGKSSKNPCCICFDRYLKIRITYGSFFRILPCKHIYHSNCIEEWVSEKKINSTCPLCLRLIFL